MYTTTIDLQKRLGIGLMTRPRMVWFRWSIWLDLEIWNQTRDACGTPHALYQQASSLGTVGTLSAIRATAL